jgi:cytochrome P450
MLDPPVHTAYRRLVSRGFTPRQVATLEPAVRQFAIERLEQLRADGSGDFVSSFAGPLPSFIVATYLGVPAEDRARFDTWSDASSKPTREVTSCATRPARWPTSTATSASWSTAAGSSPVTT